MYCSTPGAFSLASLAFVLLMAVRYTILAKCRQYHGVPELPGGKIVCV